MFQNSDLSEYRLKGAKYIRETGSLLARDQLYERNWFTSRLYQKWDRYFICFGNIVNSYINENLIDMSSD